MMNHCKNRLLTWFYSVLFELLIAVTQLKHQKIENFDMFSSKREISRSSGRTGDSLSKRESPVQNGRVGTYVTDFTNFRCNLEKIWDRKIAIKSYQFIFDPIL